MTALAPELAARHQARRLRRAAPPASRIGLRMLVLVDDPGRASAWPCSRARSSTRCSTTASFTRQNGAAHRRDARARSRSDSSSFSAYLYVVRDVLRRCRTRARRSCSTSSRTASTSSTAFALYAWRGVEGLALVVDDRVHRRRGRRRSLALRRDLGRLEGRARSSPRCGGSSSRWSRPPRVVVGIDRAIGYATLRRRPSPCSRSRARRRHGRSSSATLQLLGIPLIRMIRDILRRDGAAVAGRRVTIARRRRVYPPPPLGPGPVGVPTRRRPRRSRGRTRRHRQRLRPPAGPRRRARHRDRPAHDPLRRRGVRRPRRAVQRGVLAQGRDLADVLPETAAPSPGAFEETLPARSPTTAPTASCASTSRPASPARCSPPRSRRRRSKGTLPGRGRRLAERLDGPRHPVHHRACGWPSDGADLDADRRARPRTMARRTRLFGALDTLEHLRRGGRIGGAQAMLGGMLSIKPVIEVRDGVVAEAGKVRTRSARASRHLADKLARRDGPAARVRVPRAGARHRRVPRAARADRAARPDRVRRRSDR